MGWLLVGCAPLVIELPVADTAVEDWQIEGEVEGAAVGSSLGRMDRELLVGGRDAVAVHSIPSGTRGFSEGRLVVRQTGLRTFSGSGGLLAVGVPDQGVVWLLDASLRGEVAADEGLPLQSDEDDGFGTGLATVDLDGDGVVEVAAGAPGEAWTAGRLYVLAGELDDPLVRLTGAWADDALGATVLAGDVDGDGYEDVVACAPSYDLSGDKDAGSCYLIAGGEEPGSEGSVYTKADDTVVGDVGDELGAIAAIGDVNEDGLADLLLSAGEGAVLLLGGSWDEEWDTHLRVEGGSVYALGPGELVVASPSEAGRVLRYEVDGTLVDDTAGMGTEGLGSGLVFWNGGLVTGASAWSQSCAGCGRAFELPSN
jgi:hypothetical protein